MSSAKNVHEKFAVKHPMALTEGLVVQNSGDELLIYDLEANRAVCLNQTATLVWQNCDGKSDVRTITEKLEVKLGKAIEPDLILFALDQLKSEGLLSNGETIPTGFDGMSRRELAKKIGFGSLVALPIVSAIVAPKAILAQSCNLGQPGDVANMTTCIGTLAQCTTFCATDMFAAAGCCSGMVEVQPGSSDMTCGVGCPCVCL